MDVSRELALDADLGSLGCFKSAGVGTWGSGALSSCLGSVFVLVSTVLACPFFLVLYAMVKHRQITARRINNDTTMILLWFFLLKSVAFAKLVMVPLAKYFGGLAFSSKGFS